MFLLATLLLTSAILSPPERVVSLNVCTDQLLIALADREQIVGVSYFATDPTNSAYANEAKGLHQLRGTAEEVIALNPDLVLTGRYSTRQTTALLKRLDYEVMEFTPETRIEDIRTNLRQLGAAIGKSDKAEKIIERMDQRIASARQDREEQAPLFATYEPNGFSSGKGTLMNEIATLAGYRTLGEELGFFTRRISLETLLAARPNVINISSRNGTSLAREALKHPALDHLLSDTVETSIPANLTNCGTPKTVKALEFLVVAYP